MLLKAGADVLERCDSHDLINGKDVFGKTAAAVASARGHSHLSAYLYFMETLAHLKAGRMAEATTALTASKAENAKGFNYWASYIFNEAFSIDRARIASTDRDRGAAAAAGDGGGRAATVAAVSGGGAGTPTSCAVDSTYYLNAEQRQQLKRLSGEEQIAQALAEPFLEYFQKAVSSLENPFSELLVSDITRLEKEMAHFTLLLSVTTQEEVAEVKQLDSLTAELSPAYKTLLGQLHCPFYTESSAAPRGAVFKELLRKSKLIKNG